MGSSFSNRFFEIGCAVDNSATMLEGLRKAYVRPCSGISLGGYVMPLTSMPSWPLSSSVSERR